jgi:hypothetical protein
MNSSRRKFLQFALSAPLAAQLGDSKPGAWAQPLSVLEAGQGQSQFQNPQIIRYDAQCFTLNGQDTFIHSGAFHYCRCPRELWRDRLLKFKQAGFNAIETYVFWNYHEPVEGKIDLAEFEDFVKLVHQMGFWMIARPGPYVCAEWDAGGFPHWVIARQFPLRSASPESIQTSEHWYKAVLPVIQRHQITNSGPIIMIQIENEYDYWKLPDAEKRKYITALANMVWNAGIDIPIITNWCEQARVNSDPVMARIMDTADFYPRWNIVKEVVPQLEKLRKQEPNSPLGITELQGGWFSEFGGKLSVDQPGVGPKQLNVLTKTVIEQGVTYYSYYMGFGGTNFDWAAKNLTTTYDYAAPIREPGGLWGKYDEARGICAFLNQFGSVLNRAQVLDGPQSANPAISVTERAAGKSGVLFVRNNQNQNQRFKLSFPDPASPTHRIITVPREGQLEMGAREMKMLPVQVRLPGGQLRYSTAEALGFGTLQDRPFLIVYDVPGRLAEIAFATEEEPKIEGDTVYQYWDSEYESVVIGLKLDKPEKMLLVNGLQVVAVERERALKSWIADYPFSIAPESESKKTIQVAYITDAALMEETGSEHQRAWVDLRFSPGEHAVTALLPAEPSKCLVDGNATQVTYDDHWRSARLRIMTPALPAQPINLTEVDTWVEKFDLHSGNWLTSPVQPLEKLGEIPYGYVKYWAQFSGSGDAKLFLSTLDDDRKQVFINGKQVKEAANHSSEVEFSLAPYAQSGANTIEIAYELFGSYNFGERIARLKGIKSAGIGADVAHASPISEWKIQLVPAAMRGRNIDPDFSAGEWQRASLSGSASSDWLPAFCWTQATFSLETPSENWSVAWKAAIESDRDALLYLNGRFVGRYMTIGPQKEFYLPEPWLQFGSGSKNILTVVLAYTNAPQHLRSLRIAPYDEFATRRTRLEFRWR